MTPSGRYAYFRRQLRRELGDAIVPAAAERHLTRAASVAQILEVVEHEILLGKIHDDLVLAELRAEATRSTMDAMRETIAALAKPKRPADRGRSRRQTPSLNPPKAA